MTHQNPPRATAEVLLDPGVVEWNEQTWGLKAHHVEYLPEGKSSARLRGVLYRDRKGHVRQPRLDPYLALAFESSAPEGSPQRERQWLSASSQLASDLATGRLTGAANLPPELIDARPFTWGGLSTTVRYTYAGDLPHEPSLAEAAIRKRISKAARTGYSFEPQVSTEDLQRLLVSTGSRQQFSYGLDLRDLQRLAELVSPDVFRCHAVRNSSGAVISAGARLIAADGFALDWVQGTDPSALNDGAVQMMYAGVLQDLSDAGAKFFDFGGANIAPVARAKSSWGFDLVPYISVARPSAKQLALQIPAIKAIALRIRR